jgi:hypothetical protein
LNLLPCVVCGGASVSGGGVRRQAKALEDRCPTEDELRVAKSYVKQLDDMTREDHLRSIDELLAQVPNEFAAAVKKLEVAEEFVLIAASGVVERVAKRLDSDWELINAVDVRRRIVAAECGILRCPWLCSRVHGMLMWRLHVARGAPRRTRDCRSGMATPRCTLPLLVIMRMWWRCCWSVGPRSTHKTCVGAPLGPCFHRSCARTHATPRCLLCSCYAVRGLYTATLGCREQLCVNHRPAASSGCGHPHSSQCTCGKACVGFPVHGHPCRWARGLQHRRCSVAAAASRT